jgi:hypothetical protein
MVAQRLLSVTARRRRRRPSLIDPYERYVRRLVARGQPEWITALPRTDLSWGHRVHPKPYTITWRPCGHLEHTHPSRLQRNGKSARASPRHLRRWKTSLRSVPRGCFCRNRMIWMKPSGRNLRSSDRPAQALRLHIASRKRFCA